MKQEQSQKEEPVQEKLRAPLSERVLSCSAAALRGKKSKIEEVFSAPHAMLAGVDEEGTLSGRCHAPREEDEQPCMVVWHMRTSALSMMERLATALSKRNVLFTLVS